MGCQKDIAHGIIKKNADYVLALKGNQGTFLEDVDLFFNSLEQPHMQNIKMDYCKTHEKSHGRDEVREYWITSEIEWLNNKDDWSGLTTIGKAVSTRMKKGKTSIETRYYIGSIGADAHLFSQAVRGHWGIENSLHWVLDVGFREDACRIHIGNAAENLAILRHFALALLKNEKSTKKGVMAKRKKAAWDNEYLEKILRAQNFF